MERWSRLFRMKGAAWLIVILLVCSIPAVLTRSVNCNQFATDGTKRSGTRTYRRARRTSEKRSELNRHEIDQEHSAIGTFGERTINFPSNRIDNCEDLKECASPSRTQIKTDGMERGTSSAAIIGKIIGSAAKSNIFFSYNENAEPVLNYYGLMLAGAVARSVSAAAVHPLNVIKTLLQTRNGQMPAMKWSVLSRGAGSQLIMSVPHGAMSFVVTEKTKLFMAQFSNNSSLSRIVPRKILNPAMDFLSSSISTFICSSISTPQMVITDRIMAGVYSHFFVAIINILRDEGIRGFYKGWLPALVQKIPSYALTWMFFQQLKALFFVIMERTGTTFENTLLGSAAAACACSVMIPVDTIKTRLVTQRPGSEQYYTGMIDCFSKIMREEGVGSLYNSLPPRLISVTPMIGIQFGVYELMKRLLVGQPPPKQKTRKVSVHK